jgi:hypothetical protein
MYWMGSILDEGVRYGQYDKFELMEHTT